MHLISFGTLLSPFLLLTRPAAGLRYKTKERGRERALREREGGREGKRERGVRGWALYVGPVAVQEGLLIGSGFYRQTREYGRSSVLGPDFNLACISTEVGKVCVSPPTFVGLIWECGSAVEHSLFTLGRSGPPFSRIRHTPSPCDLSFSRYRRKPLQVSENFNSEKDTFHNRLYQFYCACRYICQICAVYRYVVGTPGVC